MRIHGEEDKSDQCLKGREIIRVVKRRIRMLTMLLLLVFGLMAAYCCYSVYFYGGRWIANPYNPRISSQKQSVIMGTVTDRDGTVLAYTDETG